MPDIKIFVADDVNEGGLAPLREAGFEVEKRTGLKGDELAEAAASADGLVVRSETKVTAQLLDAAARLRVIGRAGVGVDNIDVAAATQRGVVVLNAPDGNTMTTAEHTLALLLARARLRNEGRRLRPVRRARTGARRRDRTRAARRGLRARRLLYRPHAPDAGDARHRRREGARAHEAGRLRHQLRARGAGGRARPPRGPQRGQG